MVEGKIFTSAHGDRDSSRGGSPWLATVARGRSEALDLDRVIYERARGMFSKRDGRGSLRSEGW